MAGVAATLGAGCASTDATGPGDGRAGDGSRASGASSATARLDRLAWLVGDWRRVDFKIPAGERWWRDGDQLLAEAWHADADGQVLDERLRIAVDGDSLVYRAEVVGRGGPPTEFRLADQFLGVVAFENREHAEPWRIEYASDGDLLLVRVHFARGSGLPDRIQELTFVRPDER